MAYTLFNHQKELLRLVTQHDNFLVLAEVGTGKTLPMLIHMSNLLLAGEIETILIVAPMSGLGAWSRDIDLLSSDRQRLLRDAITLINYDKLSRKTSKYQKEIWRDWDFILLDEGHAICNPTSNRTKYFVGNAKSAGLNTRSQYRYLLTGTLITNSRLQDAWGPLKFILPTYLAYRDFKHRYLVTRNLPGSYAEIIVGYRNSQELLDFIAQHSYRILKKDCLDLPEQLPDEVITVPFPQTKNKAPFNKSSDDLYTEALDAYVSSIDKVADNPLTRMLLLRQIASGHIKEADGRTVDGKLVKGETYTLNTDKVKYLMELVQNNLPNKTVVFYQFTHSCDAITKALDKAKIKYLVLNGATKDKNCWKEFQADDGIKVFVVQYQSGSSAIDLFSASYTIYFEPTNSSNLLEQSRARTHRNGQKQTCNYVFLLTENTIEVDMYDTLCKHTDFTEKTYREIARLRLEKRL